MKQPRWPLTFLVLMLACVTSITYADEALTSSSPYSISVKAWIGSENSTPNREPEKAYAVSEQIVLTIDVSTPRWFLGPTTIGKIDIPNLIVKQRNQLATNYTDRKDGVTWSHQRWEITLYPQSSGDFTLPKVPVTATIAGEGGKKIQGTVSTPDFSFKVALPDGQLTDKNQWFSATKVAVEQDWQTSHDQLKVGDTITRTIKVTADDSLSILLPKLLSEKSTSSYQAYAEPAQLVDKSIRGNYQSSREDKVVYVMQQGGKVSFPAFDVTWWNTENQTVEKINIAGESFQVKHTLHSFIQTYWLWCVLLLGALCVVAILLVIMIRYYQRHPLPLFIQFNQSLAKGDFKNARLLLYIKLKQVMDKDAFSQTDDLQALTTGIADCGEDSKLMKSYWKQIQRKKNHSRDLFRPLKLTETLAEISQKPD